MPSDRSPSWCRIAVRRRPPWLSRDSVVTTGVLYVLVLFAAAVVVTGDLSCVGLGPQDATAEKNIPCPVEKQCSFQKLQFIFSRQPKIHYLWFLRGLKISDDRKNRNSSSTVCDFGKHLPTILILAVLLFVAEMTTLPMTYLMSMAMQPVVGVFSGLLHAFQASSNLQVPLDSKFELQTTPSINEDPVPWSEFYYSSYMCKYELLLDSLATRVLMFMLLVVAGDVERNPGPINGGTKLTLETLGYFPCTIKGGKNIISRVAVRYRFLCTFLLKDEQGYRLANIDKQASYIPEDAMHIIFTWWLREDTECSWEKLISSLRKCELHVVAQDIEDALGDPPSEGPAKSGSSVPPERYKYRHLQLYADSQKIALQFFSLTNTTMKVLISNDVSVEEVKSYAIRFPLIKSKREPKLADIIEPARTIYKIFDILENEHYITFHNFELLESIIDELCKENSKPLREELEKYRTDFRQYIERRVFESSLYYEGKFKPEAVTEGCNLLLIMDEKWSCDTTLKRTIDLQIYICGIFDIACCTLRLEVIKSNSLHLYYTIPACVERHILSMKKVQADLLIKQGIIQMDCGDQRIVLKEYAWKCVQEGFIREKWLDGVHELNTFKNARGLNTFENARGFFVSDDRIVIHDLNYQANCKGQKYAVHIVNKQNFQLLFSLSGRFEELRGISVDSDGFIYIADTGNYRIIKFNPDGLYQCQSSKYLKTSSTEVVNPHMFCRPYSIVVVGEKVIVSDNQLNKIQVLNRKDLKPLFRSKPEFSPDFIHTPREIANDSEMLYVVGHPQKAIITFKVLEREVCNPIVLLNWQLQHDRNFAMHRLRSICLHDNSVFISSYENKVIRFNSKTGLVETTIIVKHPVEVVADKEALYILHGFRGSRSIIKIPHGELSQQSYYYASQQFKDPGNMEINIGSSGSYGEYSDFFKVEPAVKHLSYGTPRGIAVSSDGHMICITDGVYDREHQSIVYMVRRFSEYNKEDFRIVGSFQAPRGIAVDDKNEFIYVADTEHNRILKFTIDGEFKKISCLFVGEPPSEKLLLSRPYGVQFYCNMLFVCDKHNGQIIMFDPDLIGHHCVKFRDTFSPHDLAFDSISQKLFVVGPPKDTIAIFQFDESKKELKEIDTIEKVGGRKLRSMRSITIFNDIIYAAETDNNTIVCFTTNCELRGEYTFNHPLVLAAYENSIYVTSERTFTVTTYKNVVGESPDDLNRQQENIPQCLKTDDFHQNTDFKYKPPSSLKGIAITSQHAEYVTDSVEIKLQGHIKHMIRKYSQEGDEVMRITGPFRGPRGIACGSDDCLFVTDTDRHVVLKFNKDGVFICETERKYRNGPYWSMFCRPYGILMHNNKLYVCDRDHNRIVILNTDLKWHLCSDSNDLMGHPTDIAYESENRFYVVTTSENYASVIVLEQTNEKLAVKEGFSDIRKKDCDPVKLKRLSSVAINGDYVYVAELDHSRIVCFTTEKEFVNEWNIPKTLFNERRDPEGFTLHIHEGFLYVCLSSSVSKCSLEDMHQMSTLNWHLEIPRKYTYNEDEFYVPQKVRGVKVTEDCILTTISLNENGFTFYAFQIHGLDDKPKYEIRGPFHIPRGIDMDDSKCVYVADSGNHCILKFDAYKSDLVAKTDSQLYSPHGLLVQNGYVYVCDTYGDRIVVFDLELKFKNVSDNGVNSISNPTDIAYDKNRDIFFVVGDEQYPIILFRHNPENKNNAIAVILRFCRVETRKLNRLRSIAIDNGNVYVTEIDEDKIVCFKIGENNVFIDDYPIPHPTVLDAHRGKIWMNCADGFQNLYAAPSLVVNVHITTEDDNEPDNIKIDEAAQFGFPKLALEFNCSGGKVTHDVEKRLLTATTPSDLPVIINLHTEQDKQGEKRGRDESDESLISAKIQRTQGEKRGRDESDESLISAKIQRTQEPPSDERSGRETPEYKAVKNAYGNITRALQMTPTANAALSIKFIQENWIAPGVKCSSDDLLNCAWTQIQQKASQFQVFLSMLRDMAGMDLVVKQLQGTVSATLPIMNHPVFATKPNIVDLTVLKWKEEGQDHELRLIEMIASKWKYLAIDGFGKTYYEVKNIEDKNDTVNNCNKLFIAFLQNRSATWGGLVTALRRATLTDVADKLEAALPHTL